jgi:hypothetical protein
MPAAIHRVSAFGTDSRRVLAPQKGAEKSNEITAIPALLDRLDVTGTPSRLMRWATSAALRQRFRTRALIMFGHSKATQKGWLLRFHGVSTRYLDSCLGGFKAIERDPENPLQPSPFLASSVIL